jgi:hypothetical protein
MPYAERRNVDELCTLYDLEPTVRDIYVEGPNDVALISWVLLLMPRSNAKILEISGVDIPEEILKKYSLGSGNRDRVIALALEFNEKLSEGAKNAPSLVYDVDHLRVTDSVYSSTLLAPTDFTCSEMYLFNDATFQKMMMLVCLGCAVSAEQAMAELSKVLTRLWVIKVANIRLGLGMSWVGFEKCCKIDSGRIIFDEQEYVDRYLQANGQTCRKQDFVAEIAELTSRLEDDPRFCIDGHHFIALARAFFLSVASSRDALRSENGFLRSFYGCLDADEFKRTALFQFLQSRVAA